MTGKKEALSMLSQKTVFADKEDKLPHNQVHKDPWYWRHRTSRVLFHERLQNDLQ